MKIIGVGGIFNFSDLQDKLNAGADIVQVYTGWIYEGPSMIKSINKAFLELEIKLKKINRYKVDSSFNSDYYEDDENKKSLLGKFKLIFGASSLVFSVIIFFSLLSYFFTGFDDQSLINSGISFSTFGEEAKNWLGVLGAFTAHYFIYVLFGISSFILVPLLITTAFKFLFGFKILPLTKTFVFSVFTLIWVSSTMGFFLNLFPESFILRNYTGGIGYTLALFLDNLLGYSSILILLLSLFIFIVFFFDLYSFNLNFLSKTSKNNNLNSEDIIEDDEEIIVEEEIEEK